jgi:hypothetical protein
VDSIRRSEIVLGSKLRCLLDDIGAHIDDLEPPARKEPIKLLQQNGVAFTQGFHSTLEP